MSKVTLWGERVGMASSALIVIDMLNPYDHEGAGELAAHVGDIIDPRRRLIDGALESELVYVNDNYAGFAASRTSASSAPSAAVTPSSATPP